MTKEKLARQKQFIETMKKTMIVSIILFFIFGFIYFFSLNLYLKNTGNRFASTSFYVSFGFTVLFLSGTLALFIFNKLLKIKQTRDFFGFVRNSIFQGSTIRRELFIRLLKISEENLRNIGFNYTYKEFSYADFERGYRSLNNSEKQGIIVINFKKMYDDIPI